MYAVIETGGKQYRVEPGDVLDLELLEGAHEPGGKVDFEQVLLVAGDGKLQVGSPTVSGARVRGVLVERVRGAKIRVFKMKRRKQYRRLAGHRQELLRVQIESIDVTGAAKKATKTTKAAPKKQPAPKTKAEAPAQTASSKRPAAKKPVAKKSAAAKKTTAKKATAKKKSGSGKSKAKS